MISTVPRPLAESSTISARLMASGASAPAARQGHAGRRGAALDNVASQGG
jgi:hypothetical protein